jgi:quinol monooxygenase YgiN
MEAVGIVLNIGSDHVEEFEEGFRQHELPIWEDFVGRGVMLHASLTRMDISTQPKDGAVRYLISVTFADEEGHHLHDSDPRFQAWNEMADAFQVAPPIVTGGEIIISAGEPQ